jgi:hypothetical protein
MNDLFIAKQHCRWKNQFHAREIYTIVHEGK